MKQLLICLSLLSVLSCSKCKECYLIEESADGETAETNVGKFCGDNIEDKENEVLTCPDGTCYYECR